MYIYVHIYIYECICMCMYIYVCTHSFGASESNIDDNVFIHMYIDMYTQSFDTYKMIPGT